MIKIVALDVYGTILTVDCDNNFPPRPGLESFLDECDKRKIKVVTSSDSDLDQLQKDLTATFSNFPERRLSLSRFDNFFYMGSSPKDFSIIIGHYDIVPRELLVVGDNYPKDIIGALRLGCAAIHCPQYRWDNGIEFDFSEIKLE